MFSLNVNNVIPRNPSIRTSPIKAFGQFWADFESTISALLTELAFRQNFFFVSVMDPGGACVLGRFHSPLSYL
jgi:hypothetical protein